jgi:NAD(P)-dependent dehydrogenase (short-subunit alcohol dehydrogenase family)
VAAFSIAAERRRAPALATELSHRGYDRLAGPGRGPRLPPGFFDACQPASARAGLFDLTGKVAVITGASRGIGRAIAERMAEHGARVVVSSRKLDACEAVVAGIRDRGGDAMAMACHIGRKEDLAAMVQATNARWGAIDILVCNAAVNPYYGPAAGMSDEAYDRIMNSNVRSNFWLTNLVAPQMAARKDGAIIIISSIGGYQGSDRLGVYALSKAADMQLARNLAVEWGRQNVRANCIAPGLIKTDFARQLWETPALLAKTVAHTPLGRIGEPDEIAAAAILLAGPGGRFMTGQTIAIVTWPAFHAATSNSRPPFRTHHPAFAKVPT